MQQQALLDAIETFYDNTGSKFDYYGSLRAYSQATDNMGLALTSLNMLTGDFIELSSYNIEREALKMWLAPYECEARDTIIKSSVNVAEHIPVLRRIFVPDDEWFDSVTYNLAFKPWGHHSDGGSLICQHMDANIYCGFVRHPGQSEIGPELLASMTILNRHLQRAINLHKRITGLEQTLLLSSNALNLIEFGLILYGQDEKPVFINTSANRIFRERDGIEISKNGIIISDKPSEDTFNEILNAMYKRGLPASARKGGILTIPRISGKSSYAITLVPMSGEGRNNNIMGAVFVFDPEKKKTSAIKMFTHSYSLTKTEAELAQNLVLGESLEKIADKRGVSYNTMKSHLHSIFSKTETNRQAELVSLLLSSVAGLNLEP